MYQLGSKDITVAACDPQKVTSDARQLAAITLSCKDWTPEQWSEAGGSNLNFIRRVLVLANDTLWLFNIAMENAPFIDGLPIKNGDFPTAMLVITR
jgi:hypothetical protein